MALYPNLSETPLRSPSSRTSRYPTSSPSSSLAADNFAWNTSTSQFPSMLSVEGAMFSSPTHPPVPLAPFGAADNSSPADSDISIIPMGNTIRPHTITGVGSVTPVGASKARKPPILPREDLIKHLDAAADQLIKSFSVDNR